MRVVVHNMSDAKAQVIDRVLEFGPTPPPRYQPVPSPNCSFVPLVLSVLVHLEFDAQVRTAQYGLSHDRRTGRWQSPQLTNDHDPMLCSDPNLTILWP